MISRRHPILLPLAATAMLAAATLGWNAYASARANRVMGELGDGSQKRHFAMTLDFAPEAFHVTRLQALGRLIEVRGPTVYLMDVRPADLREFAKAYWVAEVRAWPGR